MTTVIDILGNLRIQLSTGDYASGQDAQLGTVIV